MPTSAENASSHPSTNVGDGVNGGLVISTTDTICLFLAGASVGTELSDDLRELASSLSDHTTVPYKHLSPRPREKSEELKARLRKLEEALERKAYDELVKDITPRKPVDEPFSSYKDQMGFGLHVALTMFTGYLMGYYAFRALFSHSPAMSAAGGILGIGHWHTCRDTSLYYQNLECR